MKFVNKVLDFLKGLLPSKSDKTNNDKNSSELHEGEGSKGSTFKTFALKSVKFIFKYLKEICNFYPRFAFYNDATDDQNC